MKTHFSIQRFFKANISKTVKLKKMFISKIVPYDICYKTVNMLVNKTDNYLFFF